MHEGGRAVAPVPRDWWAREHWAKPECAAELGVSRDRVERAISVLRSHLIDDWYDAQDAKGDDRHELAKGLHWPLRNIMLRVVYWAELIAAAEQCSGGPAKIRELLWSPNYEDFVAEVAVLRLLIEQGRVPRLVATDATRRTPDLAVEDAPAFDVEIAAALQGDGTG